MLMNIVIWLVAIPVCMLAFCAYIFRRQGRKDGLVVLLAWLFYVSSIALCILLTPAWREHWGRITAIAGAFALLALPLALTAEKKRPERKRRAYANEAYRCPTCRKTRSQLLAEGKVTVLQGYEQCTDCHADLDCTSTL